MDNMNDIEHCANLRRLGFQIARVENGLKVFRPGKKLK
jgi:hypothetical protein